MNKKHKHEWENISVDRYGKVLAIKCKICPKVSYPNKKGGGGEFGGVDNHYLGEYKTLKVIPRSKRTKENCNDCGVAND